MLVEPVMAAARQEVVEMRRLAMVLVLVLAGTVWPAAGGLADRSMTTQAVDGLQADFNNDGFADLAIGVAGENLGAVGNAGAVNVLYGSAGGLSGTGSQLFTQNSPGVPGGVEADDEFGFAVGAGDFNRDRFVDLAVGVPGEDYAGAPDRGGAVNVLRGSAGGLTGSGGQLFTQNSPGVPGIAEVGDNLGLAMAVGDFGGDGVVDLAVGGAEDVGTAEDAGAINVLPGSAGGLTGTGSQPDRHHPRSILARHGYHAAGGGAGLRRAVWQSGWQSGRSYRTLEPKLTPL